MSNQVQRTCPFMIKELAYTNINSRPFPPFFTSILQCLRRHESGTRTMSWLQWEFYSKWPSETHQNDSERAVPRAVQLRPTHPGITATLHANTTTSLASIPSTTLGAEDRIEDTFNDGSDGTGPANGADPVGVVGADVFETLTCDHDVDHSNLPRQDPTVEPTLPDVEPVNSGVVIDSFPFGSPGATIAGPCEDSAMDHVAPESIWYPFRSQCDWELALWAKTRGSTSTAVSDLLAIPEVSPPPFPLAGLMPIR